MSQCHKIHVFPGDIIIDVEPAKSLIKVLVTHSIFIRSNCGGRGNCEKCMVELKHDDGGWESIKSCGFIVTEDIKIRIPENSLVSPYVLSKANVNFPQTFVDRLSRQAKPSVKYGIAVDLGTTTIAVYLCDAHNGEVLDTISVKNPQSLYGDDVMSRIASLIMGQESLLNLQQIVVKAIEWGANILLEKIGLVRDDIGRIVVVGNPTMIHFLIGISPISIGTSPYSPAFYEARAVDAGTIGFGFGNILLQILPQVSGFIGGDILSAALAVDMGEQPDGTLLIDLGTNGELLLKKGARIYSTSCATGPAFEGATLSCGMQATPGAVNCVQIVNTQLPPQYTIIKSGNSDYIKPCGICGTGVISGVAELCRRGIIEESGAFRQNSNSSTLVLDKENRLKYVLVHEEETENNDTIHISQKDVRSVQLGKAALITGIEFLLKEAGLDKPQKIILAGAFGSYIDVEDMLTIGMIPTIAVDKVENAGNSAGTGAVMVLCDEFYLEKAVKLSSLITTIELSGMTTFQDSFVENLSFPPGGRE